MTDTPRIAMFLGAGASKAFKSPVTAQILPMILDRIRSKDLFGGEEKEQQALINFLNGLMPGIQSIDSQYVLVTEVLSLIDYLLLSAFVPAPMAKVEELHICRILLERAILDVLPGLDRTDEQAVPPELKRLAQWMYAVGSTSSLTLVSTNYDEIIESELYKCFLHPGETDRPFDRVNEAVNFGISWRDAPTGKVFNPPQGYRHSVLKLHGSVDWVKCDLCGWIVCNDEYFFRNQPNPVLFKEQNVHNTCACGHWPLSPVIVAPSLVRDIRDINILTVWKAALEELRVADRWFMIGYSLPIDDYAIRSMLIRALKSRKIAPKIEVYQWGDNLETESRYRAFFGADCAYHKNGMEGFIEEVVDRRLYL
jgi:hypothetical protein